MSIILKRQVMRNVFNHSDCMVSTEAREKFQALCSEIALQHFLISFKFTIACVIARPLRPDEKGQFKTFINLFLPTAVLQKRLSL